MSIPIPAAMRGHTIPGENSLGAPPVPNRVMKGRLPSYDKDGFLVSSFTYMDEVPQPVSFEDGGYPTEQPEKKLSYDEVCRLERTINACGGVVLGKRTECEQRLVQKSQQIGLSKRYANGGIVSKKEAVYRGDSLGGEGMTVTGRIEAHFPGIADSGIGGFFGSSDFWVSIAKSWDEEAANHIRVHDSLCVDYSNIEARAAAHLAEERRQQEYEERVEMDNYISTVSGSIPLPRTETEARLVPTQALPCRPIKGLLMYGHEVEKHAERALKPSVKYMVSNYDSLTQLVTLTPV